MPEAESKPVPAVSRDARFIQLWSGTDFDPLAKAKCAEAAGFSPKCSRLQAGKVISRLMQNQKMQKELNKAGIDMKRLAKKIDEQLEAVHPMAKTTHFDKEKQEWIGPPDNFARGKAIELGIKLFDAIPPIRIEEDKTETKQIVLSGEVVHRLETFEEQRRRISEANTFDVAPIPNNE